MSRYLKDGRLQYLTVTESELRRINDGLAHIANECNAKLPQNTPPDDPLTTLERDLQLCRIAYVLRADGKGIRFFVFDELLKSFTMATKVERVCITMQTAENSNFCNAHGKRVEIRLDGTNNNSNYLVEDDDDTWVDGVTNNLATLFAKFGNHNRIFYSWWFALLFQILGVSTIFLLCIWLSKAIAPRLAIQNAFLFAFIGLLLFFSNIWTFVLTGTTSFVAKTFPEIQFRARSTFDWLWQGVLVCLIFSALVSLYRKMSGFLLQP